MSRKRKSRHFVPVEDAPTGALSDRARELLALALMGFCLYSLLCLATFSERQPGEDAIPTGNWQNLGGTFGYYLALGFVFVFGFAAWLPFLFTLACGVAMFLHRQLERPVIKALGAVVFTAMVAVLLAGPDGKAGFTQLTPFGAGGRLGANLSPKLEAAFGGPGRLLLVTFGGLLSLLLATEWMFSAMLEKAAATLGGAGAAVRRRLGRSPTAALEGGAQLDLEDEEGSETGGKGRRQKAKGRKAAEGGTGSMADLVEGAEDDDGGQEQDPEDEDEDEDEEEEETAETGEDPQVDVGADVPEPLVVEAPPLRRRRRVKVRRPRRRPRSQAELPFDETYPFPPLELFREPESTDVGATNSVLQRNSNAIVHRLASFNVGAEVVGVSVGPAVTQYELRLQEGIRVGRVATFEADLAAALKALAVRVVAPIPGKDTVGVEVPNQHRQLVFLRELLEQFGRSEELAIPLYLGKDVAGSPIIEDLARMPHLLIAGTTGSGKSVCINSILLSILMTRTPAQVRMILLDPKMVELQSFKSAPHLCCDVVTNMKKAPSVLEWAVSEMETRYALLSAARVNHIRSYNRLGRQELEKRLQKEVEPDRIRLPYIVIVIDELADLMAVAAKEVEESIQRLAQKSRAVGMHVILATQRPSTEVITGIIKANLPCQIAFKVNRKIDSRVILDINGAEKLLGHGDMLYVPPGGSAIVRAQGTFVGEDELHRVVTYLEQQGARPTYLPELVQTQTARRRGPADRDDIYPQAVEVVLGQQRGSATLLQRALAVGYTRATRLLEMMEEDGVVGPFVGSKSRDVLLTLEEWRERERAIAEELEAAEQEEQDYEDEAAGYDGEEEEEEEYEDGGDAERAGA